MTVLLWIHLSRFTMSRSVSLLSLGVIQDMLRCELYLYLRVLNVIITIT